MHASRRQPEGIPDPAELERRGDDASDSNSADDLRPRQQTTHSNTTSNDTSNGTSNDTTSNATTSSGAEKPLRSILKRNRASEPQDMASTPAAGARQRTTTESTPIASATQTAQDYASISPAQARTSGPEGSETEMHGNGSATQDAAPQRASSAAPHGAGWWSDFWEKWGSVELENKGSVARDHLALERTFLAWLRTSLSFASIGIAITQLFRLNSSLRSNTSDSNSPAAVSAEGHTHSLHRLRHLGKPLGATFIGISILMLFIGFHRYFEAQHYVIRGKFPASRGSIVLVSGVAGALIVSSLVVILATSPAVFEA